MDTIRNKKYRMMIEILEHLRSPYTMKSGFIQHVWRGLEKMSAVQLGNLFMLIQMKDAERKREYAIKESEK